MPQSTDRRDEIVEEATQLARDVAPELASILLTHYPDADTLDTLRPGETDIETATAVNRAVATEMAAQGVDVFVQRADRSAFRRWLQGREDTPENRLGWIDRDRLLRGADAFKALGLAPPARPPRPSFGTAPGPIADRLLDAFADEEESAFTELAQHLLDAGRNDVLELATRKLAARHGDDAADELAGELLAAAEGARVGPAGWAELVALPVALPAGDAPDALALAESLLAAGAIHEGLELRFLPGWRSPDALAELSPGAIRRVLLDLVAGTEPRALPPGDTDELAAQGFGVLIGWQIDWNLQPWERIAAAGGLPEEDEEDTPEDLRRATLFDHWRAAAFEAHGGCVPLALVAPSEVGEEIAAFLEEASAGTEGIEEIREAVATARREAGDEEVVCRPEIIGDALELSFYTAGGRFLDSLTLDADRLPARAEEMPKLLQSFVRLVNYTPGH
ncbi:hypothetical protein [Falsiroseomonas sp.]|uniref:hypothetical protein n=1 Tax=Falsiroseomonas sp. TaxID=2870721 RepID=UPI003566CBC8